MKNITKQITILVLLLVSFTSSAQLNKAYFYYQGQKLITQDRYTEAISYLNTLIEVDSTIAEGWFLRGVAKYYLNDLQGSDNDFTKSISRNPVFTIAYHYRAIVRNRLAKHGLALKDLETALDLRPNDDEILFTRGATYLQTMEYEKAIQDFNRVIRSSPNNIDSWINRSIAKICLKDTLGSINDLSQAIKLNPFYAETYARRGRVYFETKEYDIALSDLNQAIQLDTTSTLNYFIRGLVFNSTNRYSSAIKDFNKVLSIDPKNSLALYNRALIKSQTGALNEALDDYNQLVRYNPRNVLVFYNRAGVFFDLDRFSEAINDYTSAIKLYPDFANAYINRSLAKNRLGDPKGAEEDYKIANEKIQKYKTSSQAAYMAMADTSKKFNSLLAFDANFGNDFAKLNLKNDINLPTGFLPFIKLQLISDEAKAIFKDYKKPYIDSLNANAPKGYKFIYAQTAAENPDLYKLSEPTSSSIRHFFSALQYSSLRKYSLAVKEYEQSIKNSNANPIPELNLVVEKIEMAQFIERFDNDLSSISLKMGSTTNSNTGDSKSTVYTYSEAIGQLKDLQIDLPDLAVIPYNIGNTYLLAEDLDSAIDSYNAALKLVPSFPEALFNRGMVYLIRGEKQKGCLDISKSGELGINQAYSIIQKFCK